MVNALQSYLRDEDILNIAQEENAEMMPKNLDQMELNPKAIEDQERVEFKRL